MKENYIGDESKIKLVKDYFEASDKKFFLKLLMDKNKHEKNLPNSKYKIYENELKNHVKNVLIPLKNEIYNFLKDTIHREFPSLNLGDYQKIMKYSNAFDSFNTFDGHLFVIVSIYNKNSPKSNAIVIIRDDGVVIPNFKQVFLTDAECNRAIFKT